MTPQEYRDKKAEEYASQFCTAPDTPHRIADERAHAAGFNEGRKFTYTQDERIRELVEQFDKECKREVRQQTIDGVLMLGTKHSDDCPKCKALKNFETEKAGLK